MSEATTPFPRSLDDQDNVPERRHGTTQHITAQHDTARHAFAMVLLRRRLRCHYCNTQSRDSVSDIPRVYLCRHCDAVNHFDEVDGA